MQLIINTSTDPAFNLALEEYALTQMDKDVIMLWRNNKAIIIGSNQNAIEEMDIDYVKQNDITVIRRQSGGGAVFHDLGNINFTVIHKLGEEDFSNYGKFTAPICDFLHTLGVDAQLKGRNDLVIGDMKFSGNAQAVKNGRIMHHGTILFNADFGDLAKSLKPKDVKIASKGIKSIRSRVTNVASHLPEPMSVEEFFTKLTDYFLQNVQDISEYTLSPHDIAATRQLVADKYSQWDWNFGKSPAYDFEKSGKFDFGLVDVRLSVTGGVIEDVHIFGDFFGTQDKSTLEQALRGVKHERGAIAAAIGDIDLQQYIHGMDTEDFLDLF